MRGQEPARLAGRELPSCTTFLASAKPQGDVVRWRPQSGGIQPALAVQRELLLLLLPFPLRWGRFACLDIYL